MIAIWSEYQREYNQVVFIIIDNFQTQIDEIIKYLGNKSNVEIKRFYLGKNSKIEAAIIYLNNMADKQLIDRDILYPLMLNLEENVSKVKERANYLSKRYIISKSTIIKQDIPQAVSAINDGNTVLLTENDDEFIIIETPGGDYRRLSDPENETSMRGSRECFIENIDTNISLMRRYIKDKNLLVENFVVGRRSQTRLAILYIDDIIDRNILDELKKRINLIDVDFLSATGMFEQYIEEKTYTIFPQAFSTERPDRVIANLMEGKFAIFLDGCPTALTVPTVVQEFFTTVEDYYGRTVTSSFLRLLRYFAVVIVLFFPSIYLVLIKFSSELIPIQFIVPIVQSRSGISLTPFMEIFILEVFVELLREGGLRLPSKIAQTLSIVGGIIIGDAAVNSSMVSPTTLLVVGITVIASFLIPNYEMSLSLRFARFIMLIISNVTGIFGISVGLIFLITHLSSLESFGVPYMTFYKSDMKDIFIRSPLRQMNSRPASTPNNNPSR